MAASADALMKVYQGWDGYQQSIAHAVAPLTREQLLWRPAAHLRSVGEVVRHLALGRIDWFLRMQAPGSQELARHIPAWEEDAHGNRYVVEDAVVGTEHSSALITWLERSWHMVEQTLTSWTVAELQQTYQHTWRGTVYAVSRQWTIWRIMAHDIHHGGELAVMLGMQGLESFELGDLGGHIIEPTQLSES